MSVAICGLGGLGSHVAQQLAHLGVTQFSLVDFDVVTNSSLNRLVGAIDADVASGMAKIDVAERTIKAITPDAVVRKVFGKVADSNGALAVADADVVFGCLDRDIHRLALMDIAGRHGKPDFDLASDTGGEGDHLWYGGRVALSRGGGCLVCLDLLDQGAMARDRMTPEQLEVHRHIYGIRQEALGEAGPAVVSINGVVASLAVTEFMAWVTGLREPETQLTYRADQGGVTKSRDTGDPECFYCAVFRDASEGQPQGLFGLTTRYGGTRSRA